MKSKQSIKTKLLAGKITVKRLIAKVPLLTSLTLGTLGWAITSCVEDPDESNLYTFTGETIEDFLRNRPEQFSSFNYILGRVELDQLLSSYGHYTCFAPTNEAVAVYIDSLWRDEKNKLIPHNGMSENSLEGLSDSLCLDIAQYHLSNNLISTVNMSTGISINTMLSRTITASIDTMTGQTVLNSYATIVGKDNEATNGIVHIIDRAIPRSNRTISEEMEQYEEYSLFYEALKATGLDLKLTETEKKGDLGMATPSDGYWIPSTCKIGFTVFAETDDVLRGNGIESLGDLLQHAARVYAGCAQRQGGWYDYLRKQNAEISTGRDYENPLNVLNLWVRYHILPYSIPREHLIVDKHYNHDMGAECYEYYETMLDRTLLKVWQTQGRVYINRYLTNNTLTNEVEGFGNIHEVEDEGITLLPQASLLPVNGYVHPINRLLEYSAFVPQKVLNERMRFDISSCIPEMMSNGIRWMSKTEAQALNGGKSTSRVRFSSKYSDHFRVYNATTKVEYNFYDTGSYLLYQGDAIRGSGVCDVAFRLPPVPAGNYELRICYPKVNHGGMMQFYIGTSSEIADMQAIDIPIDLRLDFVNHPSIRFTFPQLEEDRGVASDAALRARGFMRGPISYGTGSLGMIARYGDPNVLNWMALRRILIRQDFEQGDYWLRVKSVIPENTTGIFQVDYIEFAPVSVIDNPQYVEDMF